MATIITVHGTFASGPEQGSKWWQKGSSFESHVRELVEAHDGELHWQSSIWSGSNSEAARRTAGSALMDKMEGLEARGEPYCVIGHSHGGSVVSAALIEAAHRKAALPHMKLWLTVGTPFITARKNRFLFSRLGAFGQAAYSGIILGAVVGATAAGVEFLGEAMELLVGGTTFLMMVALQFSATIIVPLALAYICVRYAEKDRLALFDPAATKFAVQSFARRWLPLWHRNDEAVQGLKALRPLDVKIFSPDFAIPAMRVAIIGMMLLALLVVLLSPETMKAIYRFEQGNARLFDGGFSSNVLGTDRKLSGDGRHLGINAMLICTVLGKILYLTISPIMPALNAILGKTHDLLQSIVKASFLMIPAWLFAIATMWLVETAARTLSRLASRLLNPVAVNQLRATGFGSDTLTDTATD